MLGILGNWFLRRDGGLWEVVATVINANASSRVPMICRTSWARIFQDKIGRKKFTNFGINKCTLFKVALLWILPAFSLKIHSLYMYTDWSSPFFTGTCWPILWQFASSQLILGGRGLHIQILWSHNGRPVPQGSASRPKNQLDLQTSPQAPWAAWTDCCWP